MKINKYLANNVPQAMNIVRSELGRDAIILRTRKLKLGGLFGLFGRQVVEVTAAASEERKQRRPIDRKSSTAQQPAADSKRPVLDVLAGADDEIRVPLAENQVTRPRLVVADGEPTESQATRDASMVMTAELAGRGISCEVASQVIDRARRPDGSITRSGIEQSLYQLLSQFAPAELSGPAPVIMVIGPTGSGKTSSLAKIASLVHSSDTPALFITMDHAPAGIHQLKAYTDRLGAELAVSYTSDELVATVEAHRDRGPVLVDTVGRNYHNPAVLAELRALAEAVQPDELHLVLPCNMSATSALDACGRFGEVGYNRHLFTKADEATDFGMILDVLCATRQPVSFIASGQKVPDDIEVVTPQSLLQLFVDETPLEQVAGRG